MNWYLAVLKKYAVFNGRARRKEYWMFILFNFIISFLLGFIEGLVGSSYGILSKIYNLAVMLPAIAAGIRRMHDVGKSGWFVLIPFYNLYLAVSEGTKGDNRYGPDPKAETLIT
ncbi:MAG: DUF805 domain-containing protein [Nitrospirae bacterium]|nr:DUF805 domain-containing protein [Nitrospirota bacterium]